MARPMREPADNAVRALWQNPSGTDRARCWLAVTQMAIYNSKMDISVTQFKARCLELIRKVESDGEPVVIKRRGKVVARLTPPRLSEKGLQPWEKLRAAGGVLLSEPGESVLRDEDFEAMR